jgi:hypothetical protein
MKDSIETSLDSNGIVIKNANMRFMDGAAQALAARRSTHLEMLAVAQENDFTPGMKREFSELRRRSARTMGGSGLDFKELDGALRNAAIKKGETIAEILKDRIARRERAWVMAGPKWSDLHLTPAADHSFWWAFTNGHVAPGTQANFRDDGLHFWGGPKVNNYDGEMHTSFGAVATFALQPERFPTSPSGRFRSSPHIELFGGVVAHAPDWDLIQGNGIAECQLYLRQSIFQMGIGPTGPGPVMIAEAKGNDAWRLYLKNTGYSRHADMPGFKAIPEVEYSQNLAPQELFAEIEFRLDIYLNCTGALVWCDPEVLFRTFQWAPTPLP